MKATEWRMVRVVMVKQDSWHDKKEVMNQEEKEEVAHTKSQKVDSRDEVMHIEKSDQCF